MEHPDYSKHIISTLSTDLTSLLLKEIRRSPGIYLREVTISQLAVFVQGYMTAKPDDPYAGFYEWYFQVKKFESTSDIFDSLLAKFNGNNRLAMDHYFALVEEYSAYNPALKKGKG
jgi:hypothetical protein